MSEPTVENPSKVAAENNNLPLWGIGNGRKLDREKSNERYAQRAVDNENEAAKAAEPLLVGDFIQFMELFTPDEQLAIATAANSNAAIKLWYDQAVATNLIDLTSDRVVAGMEALVANSLLTAERRDEIVAFGYGPQGK